MKTIDIEIVDEDGREEFEELLYEVIEDMHDGEIVDIDYYLDNSDSYEKEFARITVDRMSSSIMYDIEERLYAELV